MWSELPAVVTVTNELGALRMPTARARLAAARLKPTVLTVADLDMVRPTTPRVELLNLAIPVVGRERRFIEAADGATAGRRLAEILVAEGVVQNGGGR